jgi:hypothetical protein
MEPRLLDLWCRPFQERRTVSEKTQHVVPYGEKWAVKSEGSNSVTSIFSSKRLAIDAAREIAHRDGVDFLVHGRHGQIFWPPPVPARFSEDELRAAVRELADEARPQRGVLQKKS